MSSEKQTKEAAMALIEETLRREFPHGHPDYIGMCIKEMELHSTKNHDYAHGGNPLGNFLRVATILKQYPGLDITKPEIVALVYMLKQLDAALWMMAQGISAKVETPIVRFGDVSVYSKIISILMKEAGK